jgi:hypothetical protein
LYCPKDSGGFWQPQSLLYDFSGMALLLGSAALAAVVLRLSAVYGQVLMNDLIIARNVSDDWRA